MFFKKLVFLLYFLACSIHLHAQVTFVVKSLPRTTPKSDTIFITGTFNDWEVNDPEYMLHQQADGRLTITLPIDSGKIKYKFTRGSWTKVETDSLNSYIENRSLVIDGKEIVYIKIENWLDQGGAQAFPYRIFYFFSSAFFGLFLILLGWRIRKKSIVKFQAFTLFNSLLILLFFGVIGYTILDLIWQAHLTSLFKTAFFLWMPAIYVLSYTFKNNTWPSYSYVHFIPALIIVFYSLFSTFNLIRIPTNNRPDLPFFSLDSLLRIGFGILLNAVYGYKLLKLCDFRIKPWRSLVPVNSFISGLALIQLVTFFGLSVNLLLLFIGELNRFLIDFQLVFIFVSANVFFEIIFIWKFPGILRDKHPFDQIRNMEELKERVSVFMEENKPFKNPDLNIDSLASELSIKPHLLSKVLNEGFKQNFRDFVNYHRVKEFIRLAENGKLENYTFLALAHEVGFNSKSTFNLAFKKFTQKSPRKFFKEKNDLVH